MKRPTRLFLTLTLISKNLFVPAIATPATCPTCGSGGSTISSLPSRTVYCAPFSTMIPRSSNTRTIRRFLPNLYECQDQCVYGGLTAAVACEHSMNSSRMAQCLFGREKVIFAGSLVPNRNAQTDIMADYFGLSPRMAGYIDFSPTIKNYIVDLELLIGFGQMERFYARIHTPLTWTKWFLRDCGNCGCAPVCSGSTPSSWYWLPAGYMGKMSSPTQPANTNTFTGVAPATSIELALGGDFTFADMASRWTYGSFDFNRCSHSDWRAADIDFTLGWNFVNCDTYQVGVYAQGVVPTGTRIDDCHAQKVFSPTVGNGHHAEMGVGLSAHVRFCCHDTDAVSLYVEGIMSHLFKNRQVRSFDFKNKGALSRYMLIKEFNKQSNAYTGRLFNAIDYATRCADVSVSVKADAVLRLVYEHDNWNVGFGYNFCGLSREHVDNLRETDGTLRGTYAFKGVTPIDAAGYRTTNNVPVSGDEGTVDFATFATVFTAANSTGSQHGLYATASDATITSGGTTDAAKDLHVYNTGTHLGFIYPDPLYQPTEVPATTAVSTITPAALSATGTVAIDQSGVVSDLVASPTFISVSSLDIASGTIPRQITNRLFATIGYDWDDFCWQPSIDIGGELDVASAHCTPRFWGFWLKGGVNF